MAEKLEIVPHNEVNVSQVCAGQENGMSKVIAWLAQWLHEAQIAVQRCD